MLRPIVERAAGDRIQSALRNRRVAVVALVVHGIALGLRILYHWRSHCNHMQLRPYQEAAVADLRLAYATGHRAPLLVMPTGAGKTQVFTYITAAMAQRGRRVTILVHRRELIAQASRKLDQAGVTHGIIAAGTPATNAPIQVASVQTLVRRLEETPSPDLIIIDEAHHAAAGSWGKILDHWPDALRLGVTATPARLDGRGLRDNFDLIVHGPTVSDLTAAGYLAPSKFYAPPQVADLSTIPTRAGDFASDATAAAMDKPSITGDAIDHYQRICPGAPAIAFCCTTDHAENVAAQFRSAGFSSQAILGTTAIAQRDQQLKDLASGAIQILTSVDVISEGTDVPAVTAAILLRPTASIGLYLQQVGRILRPAAGKTHAIVLDHVGNIHRHGWPDDVRTWSLNSKPRRQRDNVPAPTVRTCPVCFAAFRPAPVCPCCGAACAPPGRELKQVAGELLEMRKTKQLKVGMKVGYNQEPLNGFTAGPYTISFVGNLTARLSFNGEDSHQAALNMLVPWPTGKLSSRRGKARTLPELLAVAKERGYSPGWAYRVHNARQQHA